MSGLPFYIVNSEGWDLGLPFYLGNDEGWNLGLPFYLGNYLFIEFGVAVLPGNR